MSPVLELTGGLQSPDLNPTPRDGADCQLAFRRHAKRFPSFSSPDVFPESIV